MKPKRKIHRMATEEIESKKIGVFATVYATLLLLILTVLQTTLLPSVRIWGTTFEVLLTAALFLSIYTNEYAGALFGLIMGAVSDVIYDNPFPIMPVVFLLLCSGAGLYFHRMQKGNLIAKLVATALALAIRSVLVAIISIAAFSVDSVLVYIWRNVLPEYILSLAVSPLVAVICLPVRARDKKRM